MKLSMTILFSLFGISLMSASVLEAKVNLYSAPVPTPLPTAVESPKKMKHKSSNVEVSFGNLDSDMRRAGSGSEGGSILLPSIKSTLRFTKLKPGDVIEAEITESIIALPDAKVPVRALIKHGDLKGSVFLGEASLERNTKRVMIEFKSVRPPGEAEVYDVYAQALHLSGAIGLEGEYNSSEAKLFSAEFFLALVSGWSDASISRDKNAWGSYQDVPGTDTQAKRAVGEATSKAAERFAEKVRGAPAYSVVHAPRMIRILIRE